MTSYTVYKILTVGSRQLLLIQGFDNTEFNICVYDDHTGTTVMRMTQPTVPEFKRALELLEDPIESPGQN
jgi:hypothetical protein